MDYVPVLFISAKTGQRVERVLPLALQVQEERLVRLSTSQLNQILQKAQDQVFSSHALRPAAKNLLCHSGAQRPADLLAVCQRSQAGPFLLYALPGKPPEGELPVPGNARSAW